MSDSKIYKENLVKLEELFNKKQETFEDTFSSLFKKYGLIGTTIKISDKFSKLQKLLLINNSNEKIKKYLSDLEKEKGIEILLACETGSSVGFPFLVQFKSRQSNVQLLKICSKASARNEAKA